MTTCGDIFDTLKNMKEHRNQLHKSESNNSLIYNINCSISMCMSCTICDKMFEIIVDMEHHKLKDHEAVITFNV